MDKIITKKTTTRVEIKWPEIVEFVRQAVGAPAEAWIEAEDRYSDIMEIGKICVSWTETSNG